MDNNENEVEEQEDFGNELSNDLSAAFDDHVEEPDEQQEPAPDAFAADEVVPEVAAESDPDQPAVETTAVPDAQVADEPPVSLSAEGREAWANADPALKAEFKRFDERMEGMAQKYGHDAQRAQQMDKALAPYQQLFAMNGGGPGSTINNLLQTASMLQMGTPVQKAQTIAAIIQQFSGDVDAINSFLIGEELSPEHAQQESVHQAIQAERQRWEQEAQQREYHQQQNRVGNELMSFMNDPKYPHAMEVQAEMGVVLQLATDRGQNISLEQAYNEACRINPNVSARMAAQNAQQQLAERAPAATSISGTPSGEGDVAPVADDIRSQLEYAIETAGRV